MEQSGVYKAKNAERLIPESQLREAIREILAEMLGINVTTQSQKRWHDTEQAYSILGLKSVKQLREMVGSGLFRIGHEVRDVRSPKSQVPRYQFYIEKCEARLALPPEERRGKKIA
jgi:hypothetical protein